MDELLSEFLTECFENMTVLDVEIVNLERNPNNPELIGSIFRIVHTIKGTCGFLGLPRLEAVAHASENILGKFREGAMEVTPEAVTLILQALDRIKDILDGLESTQQEPAGDDSDLIAKLNALAEGAGAPTLDVDQLGNVVAEAAPAAEAAPPEAEAAPEPAAVEETPPPPAAAPAADEAPAGAAAPATAGGGAAGGGRQTKSDSVANQSLRVAVDLLENLMTLVSELVLTRNQLMQMVRNSSDSEFKAPLQRLSHITSELQEGVMKTRMQPIGNAWSNLPRLVRDLGVDLNKRIDLKMLGADTELDRQVLELIKDPLTHMVRNSADHGLETTPERKRIGKSESGTITLNAFHEGGHIIIEISDDGRGLDVAKIGQKALANGITTEAELATLSDQQVRQFIFKAGFSTAAQVTNVSGRGVGMDVVRNNIEKIGGSIEMRSELGRGTTFTIKIPLTLAIVSSLIVAAGKERFAIPQIGVVELVRAGPRSEHKIEVIDGAAILRLRDRLLPLLSLAKLLGLDDKVQDQREEAYVVVSQVGTCVFGLIVDQVYDTEEIVVKPVAPILRGVNMFSGNTILGDGSVVMILDLNGITGALSGISTRGAALDDAKHGRNNADVTSLLLFRAGDDSPKAVPLALVTRLEEIAPDAIERSGGQAVMQYRGQLMPLVTIDGSPIVVDTQPKPVLVFTDIDRNMGMVVDEIIDIAEDEVKIEINTEEGPAIGSAILAGKSTDIIDVGRFVNQVFGGWFEDEETKPFGMSSEEERAYEVLLVDDSAFFRNMLSPILESAGYKVTKAETAIKALEMRDKGARFDVIISDIEMPEMNGFQFAAACRDGGAWRSLPIVALTSHTTDQDIERGREVGFTDYVGKLDRDALLDALTQSLKLTGEAA